MCRIEEFERMPCGLAVRAWPKATSMVCALDRSAAENHRDAQRAVQPLERLGHGALIVGVGHRDADGDEVVHLFRAIDDRVDWCVGAEVEHIEAP